MPAHVRIRILLLCAVAVICGSVFAVSELQRRGDATAFDEYAAVRQLRDAGLQSALAFDDARLHRAAAFETVHATDHVVVVELERVREPSNAPAAERRLFDRQARAATILTRLAAAALTSARPLRLEPRRDAALKRFLAASDERLSLLAAERGAARMRGVRRPVIVVLALSLLFAIVHLLVVERPARRERRGRRAQHEFGEAIQVARSEEEAYDVLARHVQRVADAGHVTVLNRNNSADRLEPTTPVAAGSATARALEGAKPGSCLAIRLAQTHHLAPGDDRLLRCDVCGTSAGQTTCVPSLVAGEVVGAVLVEHERAFERERRQLVEQSVAEAAPVIANLRNLAVAEIRAATDGLTGLPNQRAVHEAIQRAAALAGRTASPLALVLFDLDRFKAINDTYGHGKGDEVLAAIGAVAAVTLRASDFVGRLGGEEFAVVLPATDRSGGIEAAEKLRAAIATISVPGVDRAITASFGVAVMPDDAGEPKLLLREADRALYCAKNAGRNRVETVGAHAEAAAPSG